MLVRVTATDPNGGPFASLFAGATEVLERDELLIIDRIEVEATFEGLPHLVPAIVSAVQNGPAGRTAAFVLADPAQWSVVLSDDDLEAINLAQRADTGVLVGVNADPREAHERAADLVAARTAEDAPTPGSRRGGTWVSELLDRAAEQPALPVPFSLPPALPAHIWAGAPALTCNGGSNRAQLRCQAGDLVAWPVFCGVGVWVQIPPVVLDIKEARQSRQGALAGTPTGRRSNRRLTNARPGQTCARLCLAVGARP